MADRTTKEARESVYKYKDPQDKYELTDEQRQMLFENLMSSQKPDPERRQQREIDNVMLAGSQLGSAMGTLGGASAPSTMQEYVGARRAGEQQAAKEEADEKERSLKLYEALSAKTKPVKIGETITEMKTEPEKPRPAGGEKINVTQAKKRGLYKSGVAAQDQYQQALEKGKEAGTFDPSSIMEFIDTHPDVPNFLKSDAAIESKSAAMSWIDSFLRDESGAAIPDSEREAYYKIYFPQPGDTELAMENKRKLRQVKMENAKEAGLISNDEITITNGAEIYKINAADLPEAEADGFRRLK